MRIIRIFLTFILMWESTPLSPGFAAALSQAPMGPATSSRIGSISAAHGWPGVPPSLAVSLDLFVPPHADRFIVSLQDVHDHLPSQINLSAVISSLEAGAAQRNRRLVVAVEGAEGDVESDIVASLSDRTGKTSVARGLMRAGYLMGEEVAAITHSPGRIKIVGIEDPLLYEKNRMARDQSRAVRQKIFKDLHRLRRHLEALRGHNFPSALAELEKNREEFENDRLSLSDYALALYGMNPALARHYPAFSRYLDTIRKERKINFDDVDRERKDLVEEVLRTAPAKVAQEIAAAAKAFGDGNISALSFYSELLKHARKPTPAMSDYVVYLNSVSQTGRDHIIEELNDIESELAKKWLRHPVALELYNALRWTEIQERLLSLSLTSREWGKLKNQSLDTLRTHWNQLDAFVTEQTDNIGYHYEPVKPNESDLSDALSNAMEFYRLAEQRNEALAHRFDQVMSRFPKDQYDLVLISGGFHTEALVRNLRSRNVAYALLRPQPVAADEFSVVTEYPVFRHWTENISYSSVDFLRPKGGLAIPGGPEFVRALVQSPSHQLPSSSWPVPPEPQDIRLPSPLTRVMSRGWTVLKMAFPLLRWFETPAETPQTTYVGSTLPALTQAVGENAGKFTDGLRRLLTTSPALSSEPVYLSIDVDSFDESEWASQSDFTFRLFSSLNERASQYLTPNAHIVFFSKNPVREKEFRRMLGLAGKNTNGISFSYAITASHDIRDVFRLVNIPEANLSDVNSFVLSMKSDPMEHAQPVLVLGIPHLALAAFAYSHYKDAGSVLSQLVNLFEHFTPLRIQGQLNERIMADVLAKISA